MEVGGNVRDGGAREREIGEGRKEGRKEGMGRIKLVSNSVPLRERKLPTYLIVMFSHSDEAPCGYPL